MFNLIIIRRNEKSNNVDDICLCVCHGMGQSLETLRAKAKAGDPKAQVELGFKYFIGSDGLTINEAEAARWYRKAAEQGYAKGQYWLGVCYENGFGLTKDEAEAVQLYRKAAAQGYRDAYLNLGSYYQFHTDNKAEAIYWYKKDMDYWYERTGEEKGKSSEDLRELGVVYNPRTKETTYLNSTTASTSSSSSSSSSSRSNTTTSSNENRLLYKGMYTISGQGYSQIHQRYNNFTNADETVEIEIYMNSIIVGGVSCKYLETTSGGLRKYQGQSSSFGNTTTATYYYVNPTNFNMSKETYMEMSFGMMSQSDWMTYSMSKGECTMPRYNSGGTSSGSYSSGTNSTTRTTTSSGSGSSNRRACTVCKFTNGKCTTCKGSRKVLSTAYGTKTYIRCNDCGGSGRCKICNGTGYRQ